MTEETLKSAATETASPRKAQTQDISEATDEKVATEAASSTEVGDLTNKWKRALADAENARKRADAARLEGREHGIAVAVEALAPALDALSLGIEAARTDPEANDPRIVAHLEGLRNIRASFETGLKALGVRTIAPEDVPFDPKQHEAIGTHESGDMKPGRVMTLHQPGFAIGQRLIRPARVTVSAAPSERPKPETKEE